jgi:hypothetical protein
MIDNKTVQEVQKELIAAVQRGQEQVRKGQERVRKGQERVRKGQEQVRKSREAVAGAVSELAKSVLPSVPAGRTVHIPTPAEAREHAREFATHALTVQRELAGKAWHAAGPYAERVRTTQRDLSEKARHTVPYAERIIAVQHDLAERARRAGVAEQVAAAQRSLTERVIEAAKVATPLVAEGRARLIQVVGARHETDKPETAADGAGEPELAEVHELIASNGSAPAAEPEPKAKTAQKTTTAKTTTGKTTTGKPTTAKASAARATGTTKPRTQKH